jgi:hypothetical protein
LQDILQTQLSLAGRPADDNSKALFFDVPCFLLLPASIKAIILMETLTAHHQPSPISNGITHSATKSNITRRTLYNNTHPPTHCSVLAITSTHLIKNHGE